jgi:pimeloyl-ACP methyl ester carboxylesterase
MGADTFDAGSTKANGLSFSYISKGEGPLILCMHGFPDIATTFRYQLEAFSRAGYRVVAPYMRGYAPTEVLPSGPYQSAAFGQDVLGLIKALGYDEAILIGHDWGVTAVTAAAVFEPDKISKLITCAVPYGSRFGQSLLMDPEQQRRSWYMYFFQLSLAEMAVPINDFAFIERLWRDWSPTWDFPQETLAAVQETLAKPGVLHAALEYYRYALNPDKSDPELAQLQARVSEPIKVPTLHIHGEVDGCIGADLTEGMEEFFPQGLQIEIIKGAGHFTHQENPDEFNRLVLTFLGS